MWALPIDAPQRIVEGAKRVADVAWNHVAIASQEVAVMRWRSSSQRWALLVAAAAVSVYGAPALLEVAFERMPREISPTNFTRDDEPPCEPD